jgi:hypothetical protein
VFTGDVMVQNGAFVLNLGSPSLPLPAFDRPMWAQLTVAGEVLSNRVALVAAPYALRAAVADSARLAWKADTSSRAGLAGLAQLATRAFSADTALLADHAVVADTSSIAKSARGVVLPFVLKTDMGAGTCNQFNIGELRYAYDSTESLGGYHLWLCNKSVGGGGPPTWTWVRLD